MARFSARRASSKKRGAYLIDTTTGMVTPNSGNWYQADLERDATANPTVSTA